MDQGRDLQIVDRDTVIQQVVRSSNVVELDDLATRTANMGAALSAVSYLAAYRIAQVFQRIDMANNVVLRRAFRMYGPHGVELPEGATALRRSYCEHLLGWPSFNAWMDDWCSGVPISRSSLWAKMQDIQGWRKRRVDWPDIVALLTNTPMAGRDAVQKLPEVSPEYLGELAQLPPGQARKKVSEDAGEPQFYLSGAEWVSGHGVSHLLLKVTLETSQYVATYDLLVQQTSLHQSWYAVAHWLAGRLGMRLKVG